MKYRVGQKVMVVGPLDELEYRRSNGVIGKVYTITEVDDDSCYLRFANWHWFNTIVPADTLYIGGE